MRGESTISKRLLLTGLWLGVIVVVASGQQGGRPGEVNTPPARGERLQDRLKEGEPAPDFALPLLKGKGEVKLSTFRGQRPVVLVFASYT